MSKKIIIAIDGFSSCGKSTVARQLAKELQYIYVDSGAMYRAVTLYFMQHKIDIENNDAVLDALQNIHIHFELNNEAKPEILLNNKNVEKEIRTMEVSNFVSPVSALKPVRDAMVAQQRKIGATKGIVMDGRDIGSTVFHDAELKIFLTAHPIIRAQRRYDELLNKEEIVTLDEVITNLAQRDRIDSTRAESPLRKADDAIEVDNSNLTPNQQLHLLVELAEMVINTNFSLGKKQLEVEKFLVKKSF
ncbi:MAG: Cytidylate kinase [Bacteroidota bacterium]|jgi:cytidylate kinase